MPECFRAIFLRIYYRPTKREKHFSEGLYSSLLGVVQKSVYDVWLFSSLVRENEAPSEVIYSQRELEPGCRGDRFSLMGKRGVYGRIS